ncbi:pickpocket protein 28-like [Diprion similis]|uniref:pickpocket protein 28-like n=1 Tax=Diprion similis TaxID=362088 RepID=UPI001EF919BE|nr:pickpocket protein 28-like [Diprion similis]
MAVLTAAYYIWNLYQKWIDSPLIISLSPDPVSLVEIPFPSITVCNMNNAKKSEADRINQGEDNLEKVLLNDICNLENGTSTDDLDSESGKWSNVQRFMINVTQPCTDMLFLCRWHQNTTDCEKIFNPTLTDEGICCNFNAVHRKYLFYNPRDMSDFNVTFPFTSVDWTPEKGYASKTPADSIPWRPYGAGRHLGLTLVLDAEVSEYYCSSTASIGFKMLLHNPVETPKIADFAFTVEPGKETRIVIRPTITSASRSIIRVPKKKRRCFFTSERSLKYYRTYTQRNCILECEANFTQEICSCVQHYMPKSANTTICGKKDEKCADQARLIMELKLYDDENTTSLFNASQTENIAVVHLYFVDSQFTAHVKNELFGFTELLSNTGGLLGLFMGFSFLSLVEIIYFITLRLWCRIYRRKSLSVQTPLQVMPPPHQYATVYPFAQ